jgi:hypothetical protein
MKAHLHSQYASLNGLGTGTINLNGNYSAATGTPDEAYIRVPSGKSSFTVTRVIVSVGDTKGMVGAEYGNLGAALSVGIEIKVRSTNASGTDEISDLTAGLPITTNAEWARQCYDMQIHTGTANANELLTARYTFGKHGAPIHLDADDEIAITLADNLTGLLSHHFLFEGTVT